MYEYVQERSQKGGRPPPPTHTHHQCKCCFAMLRTKAAVTHNEINETVATLKKTSLFVSLNRSLSTEILQ